MEDEFSKFRTEYREDMKSMREKLDKIDDKFDSKFEKLSARVYTYGGIAACVIFLIQVGVFDSILKR